MANCLPVNGTATPVSSSRTDPTHRKTLSVTHTTKDEENKQEIRISTLSPDCLSPLSKAASDTPTKLAGEMAEENDFGLAEFVAALRARGHRRVSSAPQAAPPLPIKPDTGSDRSRSPSIVKRTRTYSGRIELEEKIEVHSVPYLSPIVLRKELESLISQGKEELFHQESLVTDRPIIYWNLVWLFTRLQLPTYLPLLALRRVTKSHPELRKVSSRDSLCPSICSIVLASVFLLLFHVLSAFVCPSLPLFCLPSLLPLSLSFLSLSLSLSLS